MWNSLFFIVTIGKILLLTDNILTTFTVMIMVVGKDDALIYFLYCLSASYIYSYIILYIILLFVASFLMKLWRYDCSVPTSFVCKAWELCLIDFILTSYFGSYLNYHWFIPNEFFKCFTRQRRITKWNFVYFYRVMIDMSMFPVNLHVLLLDSIIFPGKFVYIKESYYRCLGCTCV